MNYINSVCGHFLPWYQVSKFKDIVECNKNWIGSFLLFASLSPHQAVSVESKLCVILFFTLWVDEFNYSGYSMRNLLLSLYYFYKTALEQEMLSLSQVLFMKLLI